VLSEEEIEAIYARYKPTAEDLSQLINLDLYTEGEPEWYVGGFKLHEIHKPAKSPTASAAVADSTTDELTVNEDENDDE
ncbi:hypothetical protein ACKI1Q_45975, partial [Streptomyces galilaeus]|uniref:hypothetical protein n=1 Tax=Streptomyces galilaeus TaxID=33899 RepID=UPI0038F76D3F